MKIELPAEQQIPGRTHLEWKGKERRDRARRQDDPAQDPFVLDGRSLGVCWA